MLRIRFYSIVILILVSLNGFAQLNPKAKEAFNKGEFEKAALLYNKNLEVISSSNDSYSNLIYNLAEAYRYAGNYRLADSLHATVDYSKVSYWGYALTMLQQYRADKCMAFAKYHLKFDSQHHELNRIEWACELAKKKIDESRVVVKAVPIPRKRDRLVVPGFMIGNQSDKEALYLFDEYAGKRSEKSNSKNQKYPMYISTITRKGKEQMNYSIGNPSKVGFSIHPEFFTLLYNPEYYDNYKVSSKSKMIFENEKELPDSLKSLIKYKEFEVYDHKEVVKHAWISPDKNVMVFSSNKLKGEGGYDLFMTTLTSTGWTKPVNMGERVNTTYNELYPFISPNGILYFSSNGREGQGGYDIYSFDLNQMESDEAVNLPKPYNSAFDDFAFVYHEQTGHGLFASTRPNGVFSNQIFRFENKLVSCDASVVFKDFPTIENRNSKPKYCINFDRLSLQDSLPKGKIFNWAMGDGKKAKGLKFNYCYSSPGIYSARLLIYDPAKKTMDTTNIKQDMVVTEKDFFYIEYGTQGKSVELTTTYSSCKKCSNQNFYWDFGDGTYGCGFTVKHTYKDYGNYTVKLVVKYNKDKDNRSYSCFERVVVEEAP